MSRSYWQKERIISLYRMDAPCSFKILPDRQAYRLCQFPILVFSGLALATEAIAPARARATLAIREKCLLNISPLQTAHLSPAARGIEQEEKHRPVSQANHGIGRYHGKETCKLLSCEWPVVVWHLCQLDVCCRRYASEERQRRPDDGIDWKGGGVAVEGGKHRAA